VKRVLVTGGTGFIGRNVLGGLVERGFEVHATSRVVKDGAEPGIRWHEVDLTDEGAVKVVLKQVSPTHLLHLAWYVEHGAFWSSAENVRWVAASLNLLLRFRESGGKRAVIAGTCAEYQWSHEDLTESSSPVVPSTLYGVSKDALRRVAMAFAEGAGIEIAWGRIFFLYGPHEHPARLVPSVTRHVLRGELARCSDGEQVRDFLHVRDAAGAFAALLDSSTTGAVNIASGVAVTIGEVVGTIGRIAGRPDLIGLGRIPRAPVDPDRICANVEKLFEGTSWRPEFSLESGLRETMEWWRREEGSGDAPAETGASEGDMTARSVIK
jgi:nucleoside-diphosphate-sugar epimerase